MHYPRPPIGLKAPRKILPSLSILTNLRKIHEAITYQLSSLKMPLEAPPYGVYASIDELLEAVNSFAKAQGYAIVKRRASNYKDGRPRRYDLVCDVGGFIRASKAT